VEHEFARDEPATRVALLERALTVEKTAQSLPFSILFLHDTGADASWYAPVAALLAAKRAIGMQAARPLNPLASNSDRDHAHRGFRWWIDDPDGRPDPASFGDSLAQLTTRLEQLSVSDRWVLVGHGQGASMALAIASVAGDLLDGVVASNGGWRAPDGWDPDLALSCPILRLAPDVNSDDDLNFGPLVNWPTTSVHRSIEVDRDSPSRDAALIRRWLTGLVENGSASTP
jgi:predicted esterase